MFSYKGYVDLQKQSLMSSDEKLERRNTEYMRLCLAEDKRAKELDPDIKIYKEKKEDKNQAG